MDSFQDRLRTSLLRKGMSQVALANTLGVTKGAVSHWLKAGDVYVSDSSVYQIAQALEVDPVWLLHGNIERKAQIGALSDTEERLIVGYRTLLGEQQAAVIEQVEQLADRNRQMLSELQKKFGVPVPDARVTQFISSPKEKK